MSTWLETVRRGSCSALAALLLTAWLAPAVAWGEEEKPAARPADAAGCVRGVDLMTQEEMQAHRQAMHAATTPEARQALAKSLMATVQQRASEKGKTLCHDAMGGGAMGHRAGMGKGMGGMGGGMMHGQGKGAAAPPAPEAPAPEK